MDISDCFAGVLGEETAKKPPASIARLLEGGATDMVRLERKIEDRRIAMNNQLRAEDVRIGLHDKIRELRQGVPDAEIEGCSEAVRGYITRLEAMHVTIWCKDCGGIKSVPADFDAAVASAALAEVSGAIRELSAGGRKLQAALLKLDN